MLCLMPLSASAHPELHSDFIVRYHNQFLAVGTWSEGRGYRSCTGIGVQMQAVLMCITRTFFLVLISGIINQPLEAGGRERPMLSASLTSSPLPGLGSEGALTSLPELTVPGCDRASRSSLESILYENPTLVQEILWRHNCAVPRLDSPRLPHGDAAQLFLHITGCVASCVSMEICQHGDEDSSRASI